MLSRSFISADGFEFILKKVENTMSSKSGEEIRISYEWARERFARHGVDTGEVLKTLDEIPISIQCWQGDDVRGFENPDGELTGGIQTSGNYPGRARSANELRADLELAMQFIPGPQRVNLHAIYLEADKDRKSVV